MQKSQPASRPNREPVPASGPRWAWLGAAAGMLVESLAVLGLALTVVLTLVKGEASTTVRASTEAIVLVLLGLGVAALAWNLFRLKSLAKTPTLLWNGMLVPVAFNLIGGGAKGFGYTTLAVAVLTFITALLIPRYEADEEDGSGTVA